MASTETGAVERWGPWAFDPTALALILPTTGYQISLRKIRNSACMLDYIFEVNAKPWATNEITRSLLNAFQDLFDPRMTLCGAAAAETLNHEALLEQRERLH
jgi:hypothetical protein